MVKIASSILFKSFQQDLTTLKKEFSSKGIHELVLTTLLNDRRLVRCQVVGFSVKIIAKAVGKK